MFTQFSIRVWASEYTCRPIIANLLYIYMYVCEERWTIRLHSVLSLLCVHTHKYYSNLLLVFPRLGTFWGWTSTCKEKYTHAINTDVWTNESHLPKYNWRYAKSPTVQDAFRTIPACTMGPDIHLSNIWQDNTRFPQQEVGIAHVRRFKKCAASGPLTCIWGSPATSNMATCSVR